MSSPPVSDMPHLGPASRKMLAVIGVYTRADLEARGAVAAYAALKAAGAPASLNLLWAMEAALTGRHWREVARDDRLRLLLEFEAFGVKA